MTISVITINYNNDSGLLQTIYSVAKQIDVYLQYIIIDGASSDNSLNIIKANASKIDYWVSERDKGIYDAMNKGIAMATGDYLMFLNSGDSLADAEVLSKCLDKLASNEAIDILYGDLLVQNHKNINYKVHAHPKELTLPFLQRDTINHQASLIRRSLFKEFGLYKLNYKLASDYYFFLQCFLNDKIFKHAELNMVNYDFSGQSSVDDFKSYRAEQTIIWNLLVPKYAISLVQERQEALAKIDELILAGSYKLVKLSSKVNALLQNIRSGFRK